jgi:hypothetical protein
VDEVIEGSGENDPGMTSSESDSLRGLVDLETAVIKDIPERQSGGSVRQGFGKFGLMMPDSDTRTLHGFLQTGGGRR